MSLTLYSHDNNKKMKTSNHSRLKNKVVALLTTYTCDLSFRLTLNDSLSFGEPSFSPGFSPNDRYYDSGLQKYPNLTPSRTTNQIPIRPFFVVSLSPYYHIFWLGPSHPYTVYPLPIPG